VLQRDQARSRQQLLVGEISALKRDLTSDMYKDADAKYRDKMIALKVLIIRCKPVYLISVVPRALILARFESIDSDTLFSLHCSLASASPSVCLFQL